MQAKETDFALLKFLGRLTWPTNLYLKQTGSKASLVS